MRVVTTKCGCTTIEEAFRTHWARAVQRLSRCALRREEAEDQVSEAYTRCVWRASEGRLPQLLCSWLYYQTALPPKASKRRKRPLPEEGPSDEIADIHDALLDVREAIASLPAVDRQTIQLLYYDGLSLREAGRRLGGLRKESVWYRRERALKLLKEKLKDYVTK